MGILKNVLITILLLSGSQVFTKEIEGEVLNDLKVIHQQVEKKPGKKLIYFWASWCPDCKDSLRNKLPELKKNGIEIITVNLDKDIERAKHFIAEEKLNYPVVRDDDKKLRKGLSVFAVPSWAVVEVNGEKWNVHKVEGGTDINEMKKTLGIKL
jgi:peroxiredoxin